MDCAHQQLARKGSAPCAALAEHRSAIYSCIQLWLCCPEVGEPLVRSRHNSQFSGAGYFIPQFLFCHGRAGKHTHQWRGEHNIRFRQRAPVRSVQWERERQMPILIIALYYWCSITDNNIGTSTRCTTGTNRPERSFQLGHVDRSMKDTDMK